MPRKPGNRTGRGAVFHGKKVVCVSREEFDWRRPGQNGGTKSSSSTTRAGCARGSGGIQARGSGGIISTGTLCAAIGGVEGKGRENPHRTRPFRPLKRCGFRKRPRMYSKQVKFEPESVELASVLSTSF